MTCKDCIHYEACHDMYYEEHATRHFDPEKHNAEKECGYFKDRSRFVELPCRPDDSLFVIVPDRNGNPCIEEYTVYTVIKKRDRIILETRIGRFIWGKEPCYLSYEEAEQALKEREKQCRMK